MANSKIVLVILQEQNLFCLCNVPISKALKVLSFLIISELVDRKDLTNKCAWFNPGEATILPLLRHF